MSDSWGTPSQHGTEARARMHYRKDGPGWDCPPCRRAQKERDRIYREAVAELVAAHPEEFRSIKARLRYEREIQNG